MTLSKKVLLSLSFMGILAGVNVQGMEKVTGATKKAKQLNSLGISKVFSDLSDETKAALFKAGINTVVFGCILASGSNILGNLIGKFHAGFGKWIKPITSIALCKLRLKNFEAAMKEREEELSILPDVDDKKLAAVCKNALVKSGVPNADKLQVKLDETFSFGFSNGYTYPSIYLYRPRA